jgi:hypothetical protein
VVPLWRAYHLVEQIERSCRATVRIRVDGTGLLGFKSGYSDGPSSPELQPPVAGMSVNAYTLMGRRPKPTPLFLRASGKIITLRQKRRTVGGSLRSLQQGTAG